MVSPELASLIAHHSACSIVMGLLASSALVRPAGAQAPPQPADGASAGSQPGATDPAKNQKLQPLYDEAFQLYRGGDYHSALLKWNLILERDPKQVTAKKMIQQVRDEIATRNEEKRQNLLRIVRNGNYGQAVADIQTLIEEDPTNPLYKTLLSRLEDLTGMLPEGPGKTKAWRMAVIGLSGVLSKRDAPKLAYDGLRYAEELEPAEERFKPLMEWFLNLHPEMASSDPITPGMKFMDFKRFVALHHIYDGKFNLAVDACNEILALEPDDVVSLKRLGSAYYAMGHRVQAREAWRRALKLTPGDAELKKFFAKVAGAH